MSTFSQAPASSPPTQRTGSEDKTRIMLFKKCIMTEDVTKAKTRLGSL